MASPIHQRPQPIEQSIPESICKGFVEGVGRSSLAAAVGVVALPYL